MNKIDDDLYNHVSSASEIDKIRHSCEHMMAAAIMALWPDAKRGVGPPIANGFYQDIFLSSHQIVPEDLPLIEKKMLELKKQDLPFVKTTKKIDEAIAYEEKTKQNFKIEILKDLKKNGVTEVTYYQTGDYIDLCKGPHVEKTSQTGFFKLDKIAGAYWRGDEKNPMLTRIYGYCFKTREELDKYIWQIEEAKKRDHRKFAREMDLITFSDLVGAGLPLFTQKGALVRRLLNEFVENVQSKEGYSQVWTPQIAKADLFKISGHYDKYKENLFKVKSNYSDEDFYLKPMNCPQHTQIYASRPRSYRDLPIRMTDFAMLYRDEKPGELNGLARVRSFSQDDCHVFCREDQVDAEADLAISMIKRIMAPFGLKYRYRLSTRDLEHPEKYVGDPKIWDKTEKWAEEIVKRNGIDYFPGPGEAAFYAPKMDLMATDALGREWQLSTVQIDYFMPERFDLKYIDSDGKEKRPIMIHRAIIGSPERFIMILLEHLAGKLPLWLSPVQVMLLPIADRHIDYTNQVLSVLSNKKIRAENDNRNETLKAKIRDATLQKVPYLCIIGDKEAMNKDKPTVSVRTRSGEDLGQMAVDLFITKLTQEIEKKL